jgi:hypothetical protein
MAMAAAEALWPAARRLPEELCEVEPGFEKVVGRQVLALSGQVWYSGTRKAKRNPTKVSPATQSPFASPV